MGSKFSTPEKVQFGNGMLSKQDDTSSARKPTSDSELIDNLAAELPHFIDEESRIQVEDYRQACNNGKGPMVACFATAEFISLYERRHKDAADLYRNVCFRPAEDKSPNGFLVDGTKAYPAGCYNLAKMLMTGKGGLEIDEREAFRLLDRACVGEHGGACYLQAKILCSPKGEFDTGVPHDPRKAMELYQRNCDDGDSISCFTLASMLLRGDKISKLATNVSPQEATGVAPVEKRENEEDRSAQADEVYAIPRDSKRAENLLKFACDRGGHVTSCHNLAVMYTQGDEGVPANEALAKEYQEKTEAKMHIFQGFD